MQSDNQQSIPVEQFLEIAQYFNDSNIRGHLSTNLYTIDQHQVYEVTIKHGRIHICTSVLTGREQPKEAQFVLTIGKQYPVNDVKLYLSSNLTEVRVNDLRDHLETATGKEWHHQMKFGEVLGRLRDYVTLLQDISDQPVLLQKTGRYHLGEIFYLDMLTQTMGLELFQVTEKVDNKDLKRCLYVSETHLVILAVKSSRQRPGPQKVSILQYMDIQCIGEVQLDREKSQLTLRMRKYKMIKGFTQFEWQERRFTTKDFNGVLRGIMKNIYRCQRVWTEYEPSKSIEATVRSCLVSLKQLQKQHREKQTEQTTQQLNSLYNKLLEWYSKRGDSLYLLYVQKIKGLHGPVEP